MRPNEYNELLKKIRCSDDFRKSMQEKLSSAPDEITEYGESVSGTDVITAKHSWGRFAAIAAAFVLVCGAVGGGAYHLANVNNTTKESSDISEAVQYASIYSRLKANKELYHGSIIFKEDQKVRFRTDSLDIEPFINYMDKFDTDNMIDAEDFDETGRSITIDFYEKKCDEEFAAKLEQAAADETINMISLYDEASYNFTLYNNGCYTMTDNEYNRTTYHCFTDGEKVFNDILEMYVDDEMLERINTVSKTEMMTALQKGFDNYNDGKAYYYPANSNEPIDCIVGDRSGFRDELWKFEWERAGIPSGDVDFYYLGFTINVDGYMQIYIDDMENNYKLKNDSDLEAFRAVLKKHLSAITEFDNVTLSKQYVLDMFDDNYTDGKAQYSFFNGQITEKEECTVTNVEGLKDELSDLEWIVYIGERDENDAFNDYYYDYIAGVRISLSGYIYPQSRSKYNAVIKLKNEIELEMFRSILDRHIEFKNFGRVASRREVLDAFNKEYNGGEAKFRLDSGQFTGDTKCIVTDIESLKNELADLKWVTCRIDEPQIYENFYVAGALISRNGYIYPQSAGTHQCAYKLKNESDVEKLCELLDKYIEIKSE
ncbi:hypothetical protein [Ruminococcus sp.]|uniref:hypothetical protein n=1 Tax=Ruminococcus sp. TaxID=41978 RepID=UPI0025CCC657|nr:hypothetical protein [Ruminococcus sp.]MCR4638548.1 hypothetical protein [Ruminococcus sp.]